MLSGSSGYFSVTDGTISSLSNNAQTWSGGASSIIFTNSSGSNANLTQIDVTYSAASTSPSFADGTAVTKYTTDAGSYTNTLNNIPTGVTATYGLTCTDGSVTAINTTTGEVTLSGSEGTATITASFTVDTDADEGTTAPSSVEYTLTVSLASPGYTFANETETITLGETYSINGTYTNAVTGVPDGVTVTYDLDSSSATDVVTVGTDGQVTILKAGSVTIVASSVATSTYSAGSASYTLTINKATPTLEFASSSVSKTTDDSGEVENTLTTDPTGLTITYELTGDAVATIDGTTVTLTGTAGEATITATSTETETYASGETSYKLTVTDASTGGDTESGSGTGTTTGSTTSATFGVSGTYDVSISSLDSKNGPTSAYTTDEVLTISVASSASSSSKKVAYDSSSSGLKFQEGTSFTITGNVYITSIVVTYSKDNEVFSTTAGFTGVYDSENYVQTFTSTDANGIDATDGLTFTSADGNAYVLSIAVTYKTASAAVAFAEEAVTVEKDKTYTNELLNAPEGVDITYTSSNDSYATVTAASDGTTGAEVTGVAAGGPVTITASYTDSESSETVSATFEVTVINPTPGLDFATDPVTVYTSTASQTYASADNLLNTNDVTVTYSLTSNDISATISDEGVVTIPANALGTATVSASYTEVDGGEYSSQTVYYTLNVIENPTSSTVQDYTNGYSWIFTSTNETGWEASIPELESYPDTWTASTEETDSTWTLAAATNDATGYSIDIIEGLQFEDGAIALHYSTDESDSYLSVPSGTTITIPDVPGGKRVKVYFRNGGSITVNGSSVTSSQSTTLTGESTSTSNVTIYATADTHITAIVIDEPGSASWNYETISATSSRNARYIMYLVDEGSLTSGEEITDVPGMRFTVGAANDTWTASDVNDITVGSIICSYSVNSSTAVTVGEDNIPTAGTFYTFSPDINGVLTLHADAETAMVNGTSTSLTDGMVVTAGNTYYVYNTSSALGLYGFDFEPSFIYNGAAIVSGTTITGTPTVGDDFAFPAFAKHDNDQVKVTYSVSSSGSNTSNVEIDKYGNIKLLSNTLASDNNTYTVTNTYTCLEKTFTGSIKLTYKFTGTTKNSNLYLVSDYFDEDTAPAVGTTVDVDSNNGGIEGITMTYGGWTMNGGVYNRYTPSSSSSTYTDGWGELEQDEEAAEDGNIGGLTKYVGGDQDAKSETYDYNGNTSKYGNIFGNFEPGNKNTLPVRGAYVTFEPTKNGTLGIYILQNGCTNIVSAKNATDVGWTNLENGDFTGKVSWRPFFIVDETGDPVDGVTYNIKSKLEWSLDDLNSLAKTHDKTNSKVYYDCVQATDNSKDDMSAARRAMLQYYLNNYKDEAFLIKSETKHSANDSEGYDETTYTEDGTKVYDGGYLSLMKAYVYYQMPVVSGKTYYIFSNSSKLDLCGFKFEADTDPSNSLTLNGTDTGVSGIEGKYYNGATINLSFKDKTTDNTTAWSAICLPFSVNKAQLTEAFGDTVQVVEYWGVTDNKIELVNHVNNQSIVAGVPYLIKIAKGEDMSSATISGTVYVPEGITAGSVSISNIADSLKANYDETYTWKGVFSNKTTVDGEEAEWIDGNDWFISGGKFVHTGSSTRTSLKTYRCFLECSDGNLAKSLDGMYYESVAADEGVANGIVAISLSDDDSTVTRKVSTGVYNLSGQKVADTMDAANALPAGVYISGGKKMVIK